jgi:hypothetical protein
MIYIMNRIYDERELDLASKRYHHGVGSRRDEARKKCRRGSTKVLQRLSSTMTTHNRQIYNSLK